jgi:hypothetical protein
MEELELKEIETLIEKRTKIIVDGISMLEEELTYLKKNVNLLQYITMACFVLIGVILISI